MKIKIDTGSRLDQSGDTTFAFSNNTQKAILLRQAVRDECFQKLRGKKLNKELRIFSACVYLLIKDRLNKIREIKIDKEYPGHENEIKWIILNMIKRDFFDPEERITIKFERVGKKSRVHLIAWRTFRREKTVDKIINTQDIISALFK